MIVSLTLLAQLHSGHKALLEPLPLPAPSSEFAPPDAIPDCFARLSALGVHYKVRALPVHRKKGSAITCGAPQALRYQWGPGGIKVKGSPVLSCPMALAMARFEKIAQKWASKTMHKRIVSIQHAGSYNCREMRNYPGWVSEHSYANALDIKSFKLDDGEVISVGQHYRGQDARGHFFRGLAKELVRAQVFSVVLTPNFDGLHKRHLHLDLARYRVDGT